MEIKKPFPKYIGTHNEEKNTTQCFKHIGTDDEPKYEAYGNARNKQVLFTPDGTITNLVGTPCFLGHKAVMDDLDYSHFKSPAETKRAVLERVTLLSTDSFSELVVRLETQRQSTEIAEEMLERYRCEEAKTERNMCIKLGQKLNIDPDNLAIGFHDCPDSPIRQCVYDDHEDPRHDDCLFCQEPSERK